VREVSPRFLETLRGPHHAIFRARVCETFQTGNDPDGTEIRIEDGGDVTSSATAQIRSTLQLTTAEKWPRDAGDLLAPYGNEVFVERGIDYGNGATEWVGLGYYRIDNPEQAQTPNGPVDLQASDRMAGIIDGRFLTPRQFPASASRGQVVETLITEVYPSAVITWDDDDVRDAPLGRTIVAERDRYKTLTDLVTSLGKIGYFNHNGVFTVRTPRTVTGAADWTVDAGARGVMVKMSRAISREGIYNVVVATGEATDTAPPQYAIVADLSATSPTRYGGRFGPVPRFYSSPFITTTAQARSAASTLLRKSLGLPYQVTLEAVPNPALEPNDVIEVTYPAGPGGSMRSEQHIVDTVTIPLHVGGPIQIKTRKQYGEDIGDVTVS
jgi:hypothetical protein